MQTSKRAVVIILICCSIIFISYKYYKTQHAENMATPTVIHEAPLIEKINSSTSTLSIGETKEINGVQVSLESITQDSRCPIDVQCIQKGNISAQVNLRLPYQTEKVNLSLGAPIGFGDYDITITDLSPQKSSGQEIATSSYRATFLIMKVTDEEKKLRQLNITK